jgi:hypothetical protein
MQLSKTAIMPGDKEYFLQEPEKERKAYWNFRFLVLAAKARNIRYTNNSNEIFWS